MITTYDELKSAVTDWLKRSELNDKVPNFIQLAEAHFNRTIRSTEMEARAVVTADNEFVGLPDDFISLREIHVEGINDRPLKYVTPQELRVEVIRPVTKKMGLWSEEAEELLLGTALHESHGLKRVRQYNGPALSYFQIEPATLYDLYDNFLKFRPEKRALLDTFQIPTLTLSENLTMNIAYAAAAARLLYYRTPEIIPKGLEEQAMLWKKYWNTDAGKGTPAQYIIDYNLYI